ncbi:MAG: NUDIX domain-containing protein, partial [Propionibacterium sp.]|nr:NUDIX domain-containing protein [Propionibacterium sp.]
MPRRTKRRSAARVLVVAADEILLQQDTDPGVPGSRWWVTPGGGIDAGETTSQAARRELWEETGLDVDAHDLRGPVAERLVRHGYSDRILVQHETFYSVDVERFDPSPVGLTASEQQRLLGHRWFSVRQLPEPLWPATLGDLLRWESGP